MRSLLLLLPAQPACGSELSARMKLRAAADITAAFAAARRASGTLPARASLQGETDSNDHSSNVPAAFSMPCCL
jgi:hypothetical protein